MKIYTKTGDKGETSLLSGKRVPKYHQRIETYGTIDELNSHIGLLRSYEISDDIKNFLIEIQHKLFSMGATLALDENINNIIIPEIKQRDIEKIEGTIDKYNEELPPLNSFLLPGGHIIIGQCHVCRSVCRRAERLCVKLSFDNEIATEIIQYLNRLSDFLFVLSRKLAKDLKVEAIKWNQNI